LLLFYSSFKCQFCFYFKKYLIISIYMGFFGDILGGIVKLGGGALGGLAGGPLGGMAGGAAGSAAGNWISSKIPFKKGGKVGKAKKPKKAKAKKAKARK
jgi:hypothetical protein